MVIPDKQAPYFEQQPKTQVVVTTCKTESQDPWKYTLPTILDPQDSSVAVDFRWDSSFFEFDSEQKVII